MMKKYLKYHTGDFACRRYADELNAYREQFAFWTSWARGWCNSSLLASNNQEMILTLNEMNGRLCSWEDAEDLAVNLCLAITNLTSNQKPNWSRNGCHLELLPEIVFAKYGNVLNEVVSFLEKVLPPYYRIQGDFKPDNIYVCEGCYAVIDWELSRWGFIVEECGSFIAHSYLAELKQILFPGFTQKLVRIFASELPDRVIVALAVLDLLRQASREATIGDHSRSMFKYNATDKLIANCL